MPRDYTPAIDCTNQARLAIALQPVTSNQIRAVGYCNDTKTLAVSFTRGAGNVYEYPDVEPETACAFFMAKRSQVMQRSRMRTLVYLSQGVSINYNTGRI